MYNFLKFRLKLNKRKVEISMKKFLALLLVVCMMLPMVAMAEEAAIKLGQVQWAAHGTKCFAVCTVALQGDVIVAAHIDEYQIGAGNVGVPNSDSDFGKSFPEGQVLYSKRVNNETYSNNMATKAGSTVALNVNYDLIQAYCVGKTVAELEAALAPMTAQDAIDAVSGATLVDTLGYLNGLLAAAQAAQ